MTVSGLRVADVASLDVADLELVEVLDARVREIVRREAVDPQADATRAPRKLVHTE